MWFMNKLNQIQTVSSLKTSEELSYRQKSAADLNDLVTVHRIQMLKTGITDGKKIFT